METSTMTLEINKKQALILRDLISVEIDYLTNDAIPTAEASDSSVSSKDAESLKKELEENKNLLAQIEKIL